MVYNGQAMAMVESEIYVDGIVFGVSTRTIEVVVKLLADWLAWTISLRLIQDWRLLDTMHPKLLLMEEFVRVCCIHRLEMYRMASWA